MKKPPPNLLHSATHADLQQPSHKTDPKLKNMRVSQPRGGGLVQAPASDMRDAQAHARPRPDARRKAFKLGTPPTSVPRSRRMGSSACQARPASAKRVGGAGGRRGPPGAHPHLRSIDTYMSSPAVSSFKTGTWRARPTRPGAHRPASRETPARRARTHTGAGPAPRPRTPAKRCVASQSKDKAFRHSPIYYIMVSNVSSFKTSCRGPGFPSPASSLKTSRRRPCFLSPLLYNNKEVSGHGKNNNLPCLHGIFSIQKAGICKNHGKTFTQKTWENLDPIQHFTYVKRGDPLIHVGTQIAIINRIVQKTQSPRPSPLYTQ